MKTAKETAAVAASVIRSGEVDKRIAAAIEESAKIGRFNVTLVGGISAADEERLRGLGYVVNRMGPLTISWRPG